MDNHSIYALVLLGIALVGAGDTLGFGTWWTRASLVRRFPPGSPELGAALAGSAALVPPEGGLRRTRRMAVAPIRRRGSVNDTATYSNSTIKS